MRKALVKVHAISAAILIELEDRKHFELTYFDDYEGPPISLTLPLTQKFYKYDHFPTFFDGLLPEGHQLEGLLRSQKIERYDSFSQLLCVGNDMVGAVTVEVII